MKCTINEFPCFYAAVTVCVNKRNEILSPFSKCMRHKGQCCMGKHKLCLKMMANWPAANRILWRLIVAWSHPGFGGWNPDPSGSCIIIRKERLKNNRRNNWTIHIKKQRKIIAHQNKAVCPHPPGTVFHTVWLQGEDRPYRCTGNRVSGHNFKSCPCFSSAPGCCLPSTPGSRQIFDPVLAQIEPTTRPKEPPSFPGGKTLGVLCGLACMAEVVSADVHTHMQRLH